MKRFKKILACVMAVATLGCVSAIGVSADTIDNNGKQIKTLYITEVNSQNIDQEKEIELSTGEKLTLSKWTRLIKDLDGNAYAYVDPIYKEKDGKEYLDPVYVLLDGNVNVLIPGWPLFNENKEYIGCMEEIFELCPITTTKNAEYTLPNGETITVKPCVDNEKAYSYLDVMYDKDNNYDGYIIETMLYSYDRNKGDYYALPNGDKIDVDAEHSNVILVRYNANGEYVGYRLSSVSEPAEPDEPTVTPITEITVGDSTFPRGDINLDGKVNTVDLLMLKKYLLGLMEW